jgi:hypothetical protein
MTELLSSFFGTISPVNRFDNGINLKERSISKFTLQLADSFNNTFIVAFPLSMPLGSLINDLIQSVQIQKSCSLRGSSKIFFGSESKIFSIGT